MWKRMESEQKQELLLLLAAAALLAMAGMLCHGTGLPWWGQLLIYLIPYLTVGAGTLKEAAENLIHGQVLGEDFLMAAATVGALALGEYAEAVMVMLLFRLGEWFEDYAVTRTRGSVSALMDIRPDYANVERQGKLERVEPSQVAVGGVIVVQPGEKVPLDGVVVRGTSSLNTAALTGESLPRDVTVGDEVISGCVNMTGVLSVQTTRAFECSTVSRILALMESAGEKKSKSEDFISKFARVYTPAVCGGALALFLLPPLVSLALGWEPGWQTWLYRALTFLVISCPCALVISIPLSFFAGLGGASREGVLIKGSNYLETLSKVKTVVFDKTGTLTQGAFEVSGVHHSQLPEKTLIEYAALAESASSHPISKSLQRAYGLELDRSRVSQIQELSGNGVMATVDGAQVAVGNDKLMERLGVDVTPCHSVGTVIHIAIDGAYAGHILIADRIKPQARQAMDQLKAAGVKRTVMLTGDNSAVAREVAETLGVDQVWAGLLPDEKVSRVEELLAHQGPGERLAFVGDGVNDAPVLSRADIGIAMGAMGSDAAIEAADMVLMDDDPRKIARAIGISKKCLGVVFQNIVFALGVKLVCLLLGALGLANMWVAIFADVGVMVLAVLNAMRCLHGPK